MTGAPQEWPCRIVVDVWERRSGVAEALAAQDLQVTIRPLPAGDYDLGEGVIVERKTVPDLHLSIQRGRLWTQIGAVRRSARRPYLLVEERLEAASVSAAAIRGACLAVIGQGVPIVWSRDQRETALWLGVLARRSAGMALSRDRPAYAQRLKPPAELVREAMLAAVPGVSTARARALLAQFGTVAGVAGASEVELGQVLGIGPSLARAIRAALN